MRPLLAVCVLIVLATGTVLAAPAVHDFTSFVRDLIDLDKLPLLEGGVTCREWTSFDRDEYRHPGANGDCGQYIRVEPNGEAVMAEMNGPGCIVRIWSANPQGKIRFYFDGAKTPSYEFDFDQMFRGTISPFKAPIVYKQGGVQSASDCYLPMPYAKSCKVTADKKWGQYYHIWARTFPRDWQVPTFRLPLSTGEQAAVDAVCRAWDHCGERPLPPAAGSRVLTRHTILEPGKPYQVRDLPGPGIIQALKIKVDSSERYAWRKVWCEMRWDDAIYPSVAAPLDGLFGTGFQANEYKSLPAGVVNGEGYLFFPMPFREKAVITLINQGGKPMAADITVTWVRADGLPDKAAYFYAKWRREERATTFDFPFLQTQGQGKVVGVSLNIDSPASGWWGEGDEKMWVDGRNWDEIIGTGSEDYFGDAWGLHYQQQPFFGTNYLQGTRTCAYRWHIVDNVPFAKTMKFTIENYPPFRPDYTSTCFWYALPGQKDFFEPADQYAVRRPWGRSLVNTIEAEDLVAPAIAPTKLGMLKGKIVSDEDLPAEFSHGVAVDLGWHVAGMKTELMKFDAPEEDAYYPAVYVGTKDKPAPFDLEVDGQLLKAEPGDFASTGLAQFPGVWLTKGEHLIALHYTGTGSAVLDCVQMPGSPRPWDVSEAESAKVVTPLPSREGGRGVGTEIERARLHWGHGQQLLIRATQPDDSATIEIASGPRGKIALGATITTGPDYGDFRVFVGDKPIGKIISGYSDQPGLKPVNLGQLDTDAGRQITVKAFGKNDKSSGYNIGLDYFSFSPITVPDAIEAEDLTVLAADGGGVQSQSLGGNFSGGTQLWFTNSKPDGAVTVELDVPKAGKYELNVYYCTSWDYAIVQADLDGQKVAAPADNYSAGVEWRGQYTLGTFDLTAGKHRLKFQSVGKNEKSKGYFIGVDALQLVGK